MPAPFPQNLTAALFELNPTWFLLAFIAICLDLVTGFVIKGVMPHKVQSSIMREGLIHKAWEIAIILCAAMIDVAISAGLGIDLQPVSGITCAFIFVMEAASVCENALEGNPELASAPVIKYVSKAKQGQLDPDATSELPRHLGGE